MSTTNETPTRAMDLYEWTAAIIVERQRQRDKGYDVEHDRHHGADELLRMAQERIRLGEVVKAAALIDAAREVLAGSDR
jgi:hypothetical protein